MSQTPEVKLNIFERGMLKLTPSGLGLAIVNLAETIRADFVNPKSSPMSWIDLAQKGSLKEVNPLFQHDHPILFSILQNSGDFYDGYLFSFVGYYTSSMFDFLQSRITQRSVPERVRTTGAMLISCGIITAVESGLLQRFNDTSNLEDIPAGILGVFAFGVTHQLGGKIVHKLRSTLLPQ